VENWKSNSNIEKFIENSYEPLAKDFLDKGYDIYIDGFTSNPTFRVPYLIDQAVDGVWDIDYLSLQCEIMGFENYSELIDLFKKLGEDNYIFLFAIKPFQVRFATISSEYNIIGCDRKMRLREQKLNQLLNE
jgi:hypothetical protein